MTFSRLFEMGTFSVPWHQRYYDWEKGHVIELLKDIEEASQEERACYFLGSIMLIQSKGDHWEINDGQQRMITVSLIIAWLCRLASDENPDHQRVKTALDKLFVLPRDEVCSLNDADHYKPRLSNHADFEETLAYVRETGAKRVVTDNTRSHGCELALALNERLSGVEASPSTNRPTPRRE